MSKIIGINKEYRISVNGICYDLEKLSPVTGKKAKIQGALKWKTVGHFGCVKHALQRFVNESVNDCEEISSIIDAVNAAELSIEKVLRELVK